MKCNLMGFSWLRKISDETYHQIFMVLISWEFNGMFFMAHENFLTTLMTFSHNFFGPLGKVFVSCFQGSLAVIDGRIKRSLSCILNFRACTFLLKGSFNYDRCFSAALKELYHLFFIAENKRWSQLVEYVAGNRR